MIVKIDPNAVQGKLTPEEIRVAETFMNRMMIKLMVNSHKGGWKTTDANGKRTWTVCEDGFLLKKLHEEIGEFMEAYAHDDYGNMMTEGADAANILMMLTDPERLRCRTQ